MAAGPEPKEAQGGCEPGEPASPACWAHEADPGYMWAGALAPKQPGIFRRAGAALRWLISAWAGGSRRRRISPPG
jgi:hypothetical protein